VFVLTWAVALAIWRFGRIEQRWDAASAAAGAAPDE
jgi:high-affinity nickel-transport protein